jgi:hypothetical protein
LQISADTEAKEKHAMAVRDSIRTKTKAKTDNPIDTEESGSNAEQQKRPETGQFRLQVDRQTKASYATYAAAEEAALVVKRGHPIVRVAVLDALTGVTTVIELPQQPSNS